MSEARHGMTYDPVTRRIHWLNAILIAVTVALAWGIIGAPRHEAALAASVL